MTQQRKIQLLTVSIGLIYFYFGILKLFPNTSPAEVIGISTVSKLCLGLLSPKLCIIALALLEVFIGLSLITAKFLKIGIIVAIGHLVMTFTPFLFFPDLAFNESFAFPSLLGQYIIKNIVLICALLVIYPSEAVLYGKSQLSI